MRLTATAAILGALGLAACQSSGSPQAPAAASVRPSVATAPADLQLLCASEAGTRFGSSDALPVSSSTVSEGVYQVDLQLGAGSATCVVDQNGNITSLTRA